MTDGEPTGTNGARLKIPIAAYGGVAFLVIVLLTVSALTMLQDAGAAVAGWRPFVTEYTAAVMILAAMPGVAFVTVRTPAERGRRIHFTLVHILGSVVFCAVVVGGFVLLRTLIFAVIGRHYVFGGFSALIYEYRKVGLAYVGMVAAFYLSARLHSVTSISQGQIALGTPRLQADATFDIRDGAKLIRVR